ncbi:CotH kinase family protein [Clostridium perfringens]|nr:CotH kinase family protein [Clostridium perfringens]
MINEKASKYISLISISLAVIFVFVSVFALKSVNYTEAATTSGQYSNIETVLDKNTVTDINIKIKDSDWDWLIENATDEEYRSADVTINGETFYNVGVRPKGNSSLSSVANDSTTDRYSLKIDFGQYVDGQTYHGIRKLALNNNISDATYMKEAISYDIYNFLGVPTPEYSYSNIKINGDEWGLYLAVEVIDERFVEKNYGELEGNLYKPETMGVGAKKGEGNDKNAMPDMKNDQGKEGGMMNPPNMPNNPENNNEVNKPMNIPNENQKAEGDKNQENVGMGQMPSMMGGKNNQGADLKYIDDNVSSYSTLRDSAVFKSTTDNDFENVIDMMKSLNDGIDIESHLNVDEILKYFAVNTFLVNLDSYSGGMYHNYYLYENNGVCEIIPWDLNMSFGGFSVNSGSKAVNFPIDSPVTGNLEDAPLIGKLLENDEYKEKYHGYLEKIANEYFKSGIFNITVTNNDKLIGDYVKIDPTAFYNYEEYKNAIKELLVFGNDRTKSVEAQLKGEQTSSEYGNITTSLNLQALGEQNMGGKMPNDKMNGENLENNNEKNNNVQEPPQGGAAFNVEAPNNMKNPNGAPNNNNNNGMPNMDNMPSQENIQKAMIILNNRDYSSLSEEEKNQLTELGISEENINMFKSMPRQNQKEFSKTSFNKIYFILLGVISFILLISILFVSKYKRRKY